MDDDDLLIRCDSLLSLIRYREMSGLSEKTIHELDELLRPLRTRTDEIIRARRGQDRPSPGQGTRPTLRGCTVPACSAASAQLPAPL